MRRYRSVHVKLKVALLVASKRPLVRAKAVEGLAAVANKLNCRLVSSYTEECKSESMAVQLLKQFYERNDISNSTPRTRDVRIFRIDGAREKKQLRYLMHTVKQALYLFHEVSLRVHGHDEVGCLSASLGTTPPQKT